MMWVLLREGCPVRDAGALGNASEIFDAGSTSGKVRMEATKDKSNFLFFDGFPIILLCSDFYTNDRARFTFLD